MLAVGVLACLIGFAGYGSSGEVPPDGHVATMHAGHAENSAPVAPSHHGDVDPHAHGCMTALPSADSGSMVVAPALASVGVAEVVPPSSRVGPAVVVGAPLRPPTDLDVLCVRLT